MDTETRYKAGDMREDGLMFWKYRHDRKNREIWVTPDRFSKLRNKSNVNWNLASKTPHRRRKQQNTQLIKKYGITLDQYESMVSAQSNRCAICNKEESNTLLGKIRSLAVDHCHKTGKVRQLLCSRCNVAIGMLDDSPDRVALVLEYLKKHS